jgi:hypothetical protein
MKIVSIQAHARDMFNIEITESTTNIVEFEHEGYYLDGGDDIDLSIDFDTGQILNWNHHKNLLLLVEEEKNG